MFEENELLTDTFVAHTHVVPDTDDVLANVDALARTHRRNRWVIRASGVSLVSAGLVFGGIALPGLVSGGHHAGTASKLTAEGRTAPKTAAHGTYSTDEEETAFFDAGYDYQDAQQLATVWHETDINAVKAEAGGKLLAGETLPVPPSGQPVPPENKAVDAFFADGYGYNDAVKLAGIWHVSSYQAKIKGGQDLENGQSLPFPPSGNSAVVGTSHATAMSAAQAARLKQLMILKSKGKTIAIPRAIVGSSSTTNDSESPALAEYFAQGYDYDNAVALGKIWHETDITQVKTEAGQKLLDGETLPVKPADTPAPPDNPAADQAVNAFFSAGYTYNDAVHLGKIWHESSYQAKVDGGKKLEAGQTLPIQPSS